MAQVTMKHILSCDSIQIEIERYQTIHVERAFLAMIHHFSECYSLEVASSRLFSKW